MVATTIHGSSIPATVVAAPATIITAPAATAATPAMIITAPAAITAIHSSAESQAAHQPHGHTHARPRAIIYVHRPLLMHDNLRLLLHDDLRLLLHDDLRLLLHHHRLLHRLLHHRLLHHRLLHLLLHRLCHLRLCRHWHLHLELLSGLHALRDTYLHEARRSLDLQHLAAHHPLRDTHLHHLHLRLLHRLCLSNHRSGRDTACDGGHALGVSSGSVGRRSGTGFRIQEAVGGGC